jgi:hypothetical protein
MNKLANIIKNLDYTELELVKKDLEEGNIKKIINKQLEKRKRDKKTICPVCEKNIRENEGLYLEFGPENFRKKASFDGLDCLKYFIETKLEKKEKATQQAIIINEEFKE